MNYFSARLFVVCLVDDGKPKKKHTCDYPFVLFRAENDELAFHKALELGKKQETEYKNHKGQSVRWAFVKVEEIWNLGNEIDGIEIGSIIDVWKTDEPLAFNNTFNPENEMPVFSEKP